MKRPLSELEAEAEAEADPDAETQALLDDPNNPAYDDDVSTLVPTRVVRTAVMRTPGGVPVRQRTVRLPTPSDAVRPSVAPPAPAPVPAGRRRAVAWSEIEVAVVVGAFITMLAIMIYVIAQRRSATPTTPATTSTTSTSTVSPATGQRR